MSGSGQIIPSGTPDFGTWYIQRGSAESFTYWVPKLPDGTVEDLSSYSTVQGQILDEDHATEANMTALVTLTVTKTAPPQTDSDSVRLKITDLWRFTVAAPAALTDHTVTSIGTAGNKGVGAFEGVNGAVKRTFGKFNVVFNPDRIKL